MPPAVTVLVVSWNTRELLERCLASLGRDAAAGVAEVWVVDNASSDGSAEAAARYPFARVVALDENLGFAGALDHASAEVATPWVACANADVALTPGALERMLAAGEADPAIGAVAPRLQLGDGSTQLSVHAFPTVRGFALYGSGLARFAGDIPERLAFGGYWDPERPRLVDWAVGAFLLVRRRALEEAGGFGRTTQLYGEDLDLAWRLRRAGWRTFYEPGATVLHEESAATSRAWGEARHTLRMAAGYGWLAGRRGRARAVAAAAVNIAAALGRAHPREARTHAAGLRRGLADRRWRDL